MILTVTLNPGIDKTYFIDQFVAEGRVNVRSVRQIAGGKGNNVARVIKNLGEGVLAFNILGGHTGRIVLDLLASDGIPTEVVWTEGVTRSFITVVDANYRQVVYFEPDAEITPADVEKTRQRFYELLPRVDMLCLCGSSPAPLLDPLYGEFIAAARRRGLYTLLDSSGEALQPGAQRRSLSCKV
jgi:tagatose 6-phosphate kinase